MTVPGGIASDVNRDEAKAGMRRQDCQTSRCSAVEISSRNAKGSRFRNDSRRLGACQPAAGSAAKARQARVSASATDTGAMSPIDKIFGWLVEKILVGVGIGDGEQAEMRHLQRRIARMGRGHERQADGRRAQQLGIVLKRQLAARHHGATRRERQRLMGEPGGHDLPVGKFKIVPGPMPQSLFDRRETVARNGRAPVDEIRFTLAGAPPPRNGRRLFDSCGSNTKARSTRWPWAQKKS